MLYAVQGNKQLQIDDAEKDTYLKLGYDIAEVDGDALNVVETSPVKAIPYAQFKALQDELKVFKDSSPSPEEIEGLQAHLVELEKENKSLKGKLADAEKKLKEATQQGG